MDAVHSYGDRSRKLEILKDPHLGAFAVISFGVYMMLYLGVFHEYLSLVLREEMGDRYFLYAVPCLVFVMERAFSGLSVVTFPQAKKKGLAAGFGGAAGKGRIPWCCFCGCLCAWQQVRQPLRWDATGQACWQESCL